MNKLSTLIIWRISKDINKNIQVATVLLRNIFRLRGNRKAKSRRAKTGAIFTPIKPYKSPLSGIRKANKYKTNLFNVI